MYTKKESNVPLDRAICLAGSGWYTRYVIVITGVVLFAGFTNMQMMAVVVPVASCDLKLTTLQKGFLTSIGFIGLTLSSHLFGFLSDICGRRKIIITCLSTCATVSFLSSFSPTFTIFATCWFLIGFMTGGIFTPGYVYVSEFCPKEVRAKGLLVASSMSSLATGFLPLMASLIVPLNIQVPLIGSLVYNSWRVFIGLFPITNLCPMLFLYFLPETPKFVLNEGNKEETLKILKRMYSVNMKAPEEDYPVDSVCLDLIDATTQENKEEGSSPTMRMLKTLVKQAGQLFSKTFILCTVVSSLMMVGILGMYNTFVLWMPQQAKLLMHHRRTHINFNATMCEILSHKPDTVEAASSCNLNLDSYVPSMIIGVAQSLCFIFVSSFADKVNKKYIIVAMTGISALASMGLEFVNQFHWIILCLGLSIVVLITTYPVVLSIAVELFPTSLRSTAASVILLFGRLASFVGSQIFGYLYHEQCEAGYWAGAAVLLGVSAIAAASPSKKKGDESTNL